ncbi:MAG: IucA/IucC family C-terminal-domain containing protein [Chloroflexota bacterium]
MSAIGIHLLTETPVSAAPVRLATRRSAPLLHPLDWPLSQLSALGERPQAGLGLAGRPLGDWLLATELADPASEALEQSLRRVGVQTGTADRLVITSQFFGSYVSQLATAALACFLLDSRVPDLSAENAAVHIGRDGRVDEIRFLGGGFTTLPGDDAADHPDAVVVGDRTALRETLVRSLTSGHLDELIWTLQARRSLGTRALWAAVEDRCVGAVLWLGKRLAVHLDIEDEARALSQTPPFVGTSGVQISLEDGRPELVLKRGFCCLTYRIDGRSACQTCPLRTSTRSTAGCKAREPGAASQ